MHDARGGIKSIFQIYVYMYDRIICLIHIYRIFVIFSTLSRPSLHRYRLRNGFLNRTNRDYFSAKANRPMLMDLNSVDLLPCIPLSKKHVRRKRSSLELREYKMPVCGDADTSSCLNTTYGV